MTQERQPPQIPDIPADVRRSLANRINQQIQDRPPTTGFIPGLRAVGRDLLSIPGDIGRAFTIASERFPARGVFEKPDPGFFAPQADPGTQRRRIEERGLAPRSVAGGILGSLLTFGAGETDISLAEASDLFLAGVLAVPAIGVITTPPLRAIAGTTGIVARGGLAGFRTLRAPTAEAVRLALPAGRTGPQLALPAAGQTVRRPSTRTISELREAGEIQRPAGRSAEAIERAIQETQADSTLLRKVEGKASEVFDDIDEFSSAERDFLENLIDKDIADIRFNDVRLAVRRELGSNETRLARQRKLLTERQTLEAEAEAAAIQRGIDRIGLVEATQRPLTEQVVARTTLPPHGGVQPPVGGGAPLITAGPHSQNIIGLRSVETGLTRFDEFKNLMRRTIGRPFGAIEDNPLATPAMRERQRVAPAIESGSNVFSTSNDASLRAAFKFDDNGGIPALAGIDDAIPGPPTISDIAERLPRYSASLNTTQRAAMKKFRGDIEEWNALRREVGDPPPQSANVMEGGFYVPRGRAALEGTNEAVKVRVPGVRGSRPASDRPRQFDSQAAGIAAGYEYAPLAQVLNSYARNTGSRSVDVFIADFFKNLKDDTGVIIGETPKTRMLIQNPVIARQMDKLRLEVARLRSLTNSITERQSRVIDRFLDDPLFDDIDDLAEALRIKVRRGRNVGASLAEVRAALKTVQQTIRDIRPDYKKALRQAQTPRRNQSIIALPGLQGRSFPDEIVNAANKMLVEDSIKSASLLRLFEAPEAVMNAVNNTWRAMRATGELSYMGIQMLLTIYRNPKAAAQGAKVGFLALGRNGEQVLGKFINQFDITAAKEGGFSAAEWAIKSARIGGADTEFQLGRGLGSKIGNLPGIKQLNRSYGFTGDALRLVIDHDMLMNEIRRGRALDDIIRSGDDIRIAEIGNNMTGWSRNRFGGNLGSMLLFAPRFLQSRLNTVTKAAMGLRPGASLDQRIARRSILQMIGVGTMLTVFANEMQGQETDFRPIVNGKKNPNFMRVRFAGRDWSFFGTWDSLVSAIITVGTGDADRAFRSLSSGTVSIAWDLITGESFIGQRVRDNWEQFGVWVAQSMSPFAYGEALPIAQNIVGGIAEGSVGKLGRGLVTVVGEVFGAKSSPLSRRDVRDVISLDIHGKKFSEVNSIQRAEVDADPRIEKFGEFKTDLGTIRQRVSNSFELARGEKVRLEAELRASLDAGVSGIDLTQAVQEFKAASFIANQTVFEDAEIDAFLRDKPKQVEDFWAGLYWSVTMQQNLETGTFNYRLRDDIRENILRQAEAAGITRDFILVESRTLRFEDPVVRATIEDYEAMVMALKPYWEVLEDALSADNPSLRIWVQFQEMAKGAERDNFAAQNRDVLLALRRFQTAKRKILRRTNKEIDDLLIFWRGLDPAHPANVAARLRERLELARSQ